MRDPFSLEAEHGVLGAMLLRNELIDVLSAELTPEDFYWPENGDLYRAILALHSDSQPADIVTVGEFLGDRYQVQTTDGVITGLAYIGQIIQNTPSVANAGTYSRIVRERAVDRALAAAGSPPPAGSTRGAACDAGPGPAVERRSVRGDRAGRRRDHVRVPRRGLSPGHPVPRRG